MSPAIPSTCPASSHSRPADHVVALFSATCDLAERGLLREQFHLAAADVLPEPFRIVGIARRQRTLSEAGWTNLLIVKVGP